MPREQETELQKSRVAVDWSVYSEALEKSLVVPLNWSRLKLSILPSITPCNEYTATSTSLTQQRSRVKCCKTSTGPSPFPCIDQYVTDVLGKRGGDRGEIRAWSLSYVEENKSGMTPESTVEGKSIATVSSITYQMSKNRWCERIGRHHKSNNIMWTVGLRTMCCFQTCHDPECRQYGFRGKLIELPAKIKLLIEDIMFESALAAIDEQTLIEEARKKRIEEEEFERALLNLDISGVQKNS